MKHRRRNRLILRDPDQRDALASTVRLEVIEHFHASGPSTVADIALGMGRTPQSLYHHMRRLSEAGIVRRVGSRRSGARDQAVYDLVADVFVMSGDADSEEGTTAEKKAARAILRKAEREFEAAIESDPTHVREASFTVGRARARLSRAAQSEVYGHLRAIQQVFTREFKKSHHPNSRTRPFSFTAAFVPVDEGTDRGGRGDVG